MDISKLSKLYIQTTQDMLFLVSVEGAERPFVFRFHSVNPAYLRLTGFSESIVGRTVQETLPVHANEFVQEQFTKAVLGGDSMKYEERVRFQGSDKIFETALTPFYDENGRPESVLGVARDITERKNAERFIRESEERYRTLVQLSPDAILIHDEGKIVFCNEACARLVCADHPEELLGASLYDFIAPDEQRSLAARLQRVYQSGSHEIPTVETKVLRRNGETVDVEGNSAYVEYDGKKLLQVVLRDVTRRSLERERLQRLSQLDGLTNIANRRYFDAMLLREVNRARRNKHPISLLMFDIDNFKKYNDILGHLAGDSCLKRVAGTAAELLKRPGDLLARFGGEEFVVLLPETDEYGAKIVAEQLRSSIEALSIPHPDSDAGPVVTISVGISTLTRPAVSDILPFIEKADRALYAAKRQGKNRVAAHRPD